MGTAVDEHADRPVGVPCHDHRLASHSRREEGAGLGDLALVADQEPGAAEDAIHLEVEQGGIGVDRPVDAVRLDQGLDGLNVHGSVL